MHSLDPVFAYHDRTKHRFDRYAASMGYLDWANQPDPFRSYAGAPQVALPLPTARAEVRFDALYAAAAIAPEPLHLNALGQFLGDALGLSAWKEFQGHRWELRCNPSSGNLHPTEGYLFLPPLEGVGESAGLYHYAPREHALEQRARIPGAFTEGALADARPGTFLVGLSSIHWREAWKYGERAWRYCQHDCGHAIAALCYSAAALGWRVTVLDEFATEAVAALLGLDRSSEFLPEEVEAAEVLLAVGPMAWRPTVLPRPSGAYTWSGSANRLSAEHVAWDVIGEITAATRKPATAPMPAADLIGAPPPLPAAMRTCLAHDIIQQRRSAVAMDGATGITLDQFALMLRRTVAPQPLWLGWPYAPQVHLLLFVHRVAGLAPGLYVLVRNSAHEPELLEDLNPDFDWERVAAAGDSLRLYALQEVDARTTAATVSCHQNIAADGAFSLGMLAHFAPPLVDNGPWFYPRLYWECGMIGQTLYLEAEAAGVRATGIGCYFDDAVHRIFGLHGQRFQSLYHFTVGGPVDDPRLRTLPPYAPR